ncbi:MAG: NHLP bacteriocin export ABC transporter permease/ATPase subunit [Clostridiales bacterium]|nr:NHLP bacteriocin export ABC transporter permease/ATPase subunit [Clostridiales bacterium]
MIVAEQCIFQDNIPFLLAGNTEPLRVEKGVLNIYFTSLKADEPVGRRFFLLQASEGELIFNIPLFIRKDKSKAALMAVPTRDGILSPAVEQSLPLLTESVSHWVSAMHARLGLSHSAIQTVFQDLKQSEDVFHRTLTAFNAELMSRLDEKIASETHEVSEANKRRYYNEDEHLREAFESLIDVMPHSKNKHKRSNTALDSDPLIQACSAVAASMHIKFNVPERLRKGLFSSDPLGDISSASHFRTRAVVLSGKWYKEDNGSLLGWLNTKSGEKGDPVAIIQIGAGKYTIFNPKTQDYTKVTKENSETLYAQAEMFYRPLPMEKLNGKQILNFIIQSTGISDWVYILLLGVAGGLLGLLTPELTGIVFNTVIPEGGRGLLLQIGALLSVTALASFAFELTRAFAMQRISGKAEQGLQSAVWDRLLSLPVNFFREYTAGRLAMQAMGVSQIREALSATVVNTLLSCIFSFFYIIMLFNKGGSLAWIGLGILAAVMVISLILGRWQMKYEKRLLDLNHKISGKLFGWLSGLAKIKMSCSERRTFFIWAKLFSKARKIIFRKETIGSYGTVFNSIITLLISMFIYWAMAEGGGAIATGTFIAFNVALQRLLASALQISGLALQVNVIIPLCKTVQPIFKTEPEYSESKLDPGRLAGDIELSHIQFRYVQDGPMILKDVSIRIKSGQHVALVGPSGSGKSTLFRILLGFEKPDSGEIYFDGMDVNNLDIRLLRKQLGVVLQSGQLVSGTIFDNIAGANPSISQSDAMDAIRKAGMEEDLRQMPMGLHTVISEGAETLSGGQRQRLLIARALASKPKILFFDEATSSLDNKSQRIISDSVNSLKATRITIAHRLSTIADCDNIIVLENGVVTESGSYQELMDLGGTFAFMANRQLA